MDNVEIMQDVFDNKKAELIGVIEEKAGNSEIEADKLFDEFINNGYIKITPPKKEKPMMYFMTFDQLSNYQKGQSVKPGNIVMNIKKLIASISDITAMAVSVYYDIPILKVCSALSIWQKLMDIMTVEIDRKQAVVIIALWKNCNSNHKINIDHGYECVNFLYKELEETEISWSDYNKVIDQLIKLKCIEIIDEVIWLREWVSKEYRE